MTFPHMIFFAAQLGIQPETYPHNQSKVSWSTLTIKKIVFVYCGCNILYSSYKNVNQSYDFCN